MKKESIPLQVKQTVSYTQNQNQDQWQHQGLADFFVLKTYQKLHYQDQLGQSVKLKWYPKNEDKVSILELSRAGVVMIFDPSRSTQTSYPTQAGLLPLTVSTKKLSFCIQENESKIYLAYQLLVDGQSIGDYQFELLFKL